jgi:hypothetical protein
MRREGVHAHCTVSLAALERARLLVGVGVVLVGNQQQSDGDNLCHVGCVRRYPSSLSCITNVRSSNYSVRFSIVITVPGAQSVRKHLSTRESLSLIRNTECCRTTNAIGTHPNIHTSVSCCTPHSLKTGVPYDWIQTALACHLKLLVATATGSIPTRRS